MAVIIFPKLQKPEKGVLCMPKQAGKQKHAEASFDCHQAPRRPGPMLARRTISRTRSSGHRAEAGRAREVFREIIQGQWNRSAATTRDYAHKSQTTRGCESSPPTPGRKRGGARPQISAGAQPVRSNREGRERRKGALPRMPLESRLPSPRLFCAPLPTLLGSAPIPWTLT